MDARLLRYYHQELRYLRELGGEFARDFPKIAARLGMEGLEVGDPYVERLLEGCAFLAARVQLKLDAEFPRFSQRLLELVYPQFLAPVPSMLVAEVTPVPGARLLAAPTLERGAVLLGPPTAVSETRCEFRTTQPLQLTPLTTVAAAYLLDLSDLGLPPGKPPERPRSGVRIHLRLPAGMAFDALALDSLRFYLGGEPGTGMRLLELALARGAGVLAGAPGRAGDAARRWLPPEAVRPAGYADEDAMLPPALPGFTGIRLVQEYLAFPERFLFLDIHGLRPALAGIAGDTLELVLLFQEAVQGLEGMVDTRHFALHCVPAVNLFERRADRIALGPGEFEHHVVPDRGAPRDYEVHDVLSVTGFHADGSERHFTPLYAPGRHAARHQPAHYTLWREPRLPSEAARRDGARSAYVGSEVFLSLVDPQDAPYSGSLQQLGLRIRCTNRDLPLFMPATGAQAGCTLDAGLPLASVRLAAGPSRPHTALREGGVAWRLLNLLSLNYLSLLDTAEGEAAAALRELLGSFPQAADAAVRRQIDGLHAVEARPVVRRHPLPGPIAFGRGIEVRLTVDELAHAGGSAFLFGAALHHYLARHASLNSFVETVLVSPTRGEIMRWLPARGTRPLL